MNLRRYRSAGLAATGENANDVPFNMSHVYASGNTPKEQSTAATGVLGAIKHAIAGEA